MAPCDQSHYIYVGEQNLRFGLVLDWLAVMKTAQPKQLLATFLVFLWSKIDLLNLLKTTWNKGEKIELVSKELNHLLAILPHYAGV